jgi:amino acid transporter
MVEGQGAVGLQEYLGSLQPDPTAFLFALGETYIGAVLTTVMSLLFISSVFAALLAFHNAVARYLYALGREGLVRSGSAAPTPSTSVPMSARSASPSLLWSSS